MNHAFKFERFNTFLSALQTRVASRCLTEMMMMMMMIMQKKFTDDDDDDDDGIADCRRRCTPRSFATGSPFSSRLNFPWRTVLRAHELARASKQVYSFILLL